MLACYIRDRNGTIAHSNEPKMELNEAKMYVHIETM